MTTSSSVQPYPAGTEWTFQNHRSGQTNTEELVYLWEPEACWITDDYLVHEISSRELWSAWVKVVVDHLAERHPTQYRTGDVHIAWYIRTANGSGIFEGAPHRDYTPHARALDPNPESFLTFFTDPVHSVTGEPLNWLRLPVLDKGWNGRQSDKGGFIQEVLGWKPAPLQPTMNVLQLARAAGL